MKEVYDNITKTYNDFAKNSLTNEEKARGLEFPDEITNALEIKGLEFYLDKEKV